ncbi:MAG: hypothetical protein ACSLFR_01420 [Solirubrobacteraceae bacterium]
MLGAPFAEPPCEVERDAAKFTGIDAQVRLVDAAIREESREVSPGLGQPADGAPREVLGLKRDAGIPLQSIPQPRRLDVEPADGDLRRLVTALRDAWV